VFRLSAEADKDWMTWAPKIPIKSTETMVQKQVSPSFLPSLIK
jgi:hypothetical protein